MDKDIELMVKQNTEEAKYYFNTNPHAYKALTESVSQEKANTGVGKVFLEDWSKEHARQNHEFFGSLYIADLDAVNWDEIVQEELANVTRPKRR